LSMQRQGAHLATKDSNVRGSKRPSQVPHRRHFIRLCMHRARTASPASILLALKVALDCEKGWKCSNGQRRDACSDGGEYAPSTGTLVCAAVQPGAYKKLEAGAETPPFEIVSGAAVNSKVDTVSARLHLRWRRSSPRSVLDRWRIRIWNRDDNVLDGAAREVQEASRWRRDSFVCNGLWSWCEQRRGAMPERATLVRVSPYVQ
jgi:hypothetical protein